MTEPNTPAIPDDGRVLAALGINPDNVAKGSFKIHWGQDGQPVVEFTVLQKVSTATLARAFTVAAHPQVTEAPQVPDDGADDDVSRETSGEVPDLASRRRPKTDKTAQDNDTTPGEQPETTDDTDEGTQ